MARPKSTPLEPIATTASARDLVATLQGMLTEVLHTAETGGTDMTAADRRRVLSWLSATLSFAGNGRITDDQIGTTFLHSVARVRYASIVSGLLEGFSTERVAAEAGISKSAIAQLQIRHAASMHPDPAVQELAKQRRRDAAHRAMVRGKAKTDARQAATAETDGQVAS